MKEAGLHEGKQGAQIKDRNEYLFILFFLIVHGVILTMARLTPNAFSHHIGPVHPSPPFRTSLYPHPTLAQQNETNTQSLKSLPLLERPHLRGQRAQRRLLVLRVGRPQQPPGGGRGQGPVEGAAEGLFLVVHQSLCESVVGMHERTNLKRRLQQPCEWILQRPQHTFHPDYHRTYPPTTHPRTSFVSPSRRSAARLLAAAFALLPLPPCSIAATTAWARRSRDSV